MPATAATLRVPAGFDRGFRRQRLHRRQRKQSSPQGRARWHHQHGHGRALPAHRPRLRQFRQSLHRRVHRLSPLPHGARWDHHALRQHEFQYRVGGPVPHALNELELRCLEHIFRRAVPGVARNAEGTVCFSDPQHSVVWRLLAAPPPRRRGRHAKPGLPPPSSTLPAC